MLAQTWQRLVLTSACCLYVLVLAMLMSPAALPRRQRKSNDSFDFTARCGTSVTVYLSDSKFSNGNGPLVCTNPTTADGIRSKICQTCPLLSASFVTFVCESSPPTIKPPRSVSLCTQAIAGGNPCRTPCKEAGSQCQTCGGYKVKLWIALLAT